MRYVPPKLPQGANEKGEVILHVIVPQTGGKPRKLSAISGDPELTCSAVRAVRDWVFLAYVYNGKTSKWKVTFIFASKQQSSAMQLAKIAIELIDHAGGVFSCIHSTYIRSIHQTRNIATTAPAM
jgi:hypothetical protein